MNRFPRTAFTALTAVAATGFALACILSRAQQQPKHDGYKDTPMLPGGMWHVHDPDRPLPKVVTPGTFSTQETPGQPPSDAIVLFDGTDLSQWEHPGGRAITWVVDNGTMHRPIPPAPGGGDIVTKQQFGDCQLHVEFSEPTPPTGHSQGRGNSGVFFHGETYEMQVLDSYDNPTYADGSAASIYGQHPPLVNASRKPGEWQMYDIVWINPRFADDGKLISPAYVTMFHNGVLVHNHVEVYGPTAHRAAPPYHAHPILGQIGLQDHGNVVRFRNIWVREVKDYDQQ